MTVTSPPPIALVLALLAGGALSTPSPLPMGEEALGNTPVPANEEWAPGVVTLANDAHRVYRRWVNGNEEFFFRGETVDVNAALARFAETGGDVREVVLLPFAGSTQSFEGKRVGYDWRLYAPSGICLGMARGSPNPVFPAAATLTVHVTDAKQLAALALPAGVTLLGARALLERYRAAEVGEDELLRAAVAHAREQLASATEPNDAAQARHTEALRGRLAASRGVDLELEFDEEEQRFSAALVNRRAVPVTIVLPGDGSEPGLRTPAISWELHDAATDTYERMGWIGCGTINSMTAAEIVTLAPGERRALEVSRRLRAPGRYRVVLRYDNDPARGLPSGQEAPDVLALVRASDRLLLASRPLVVTLR